jgi:hypothetical protein
VKIPLGLTCSICGKRIKYYDQGVVRKLRIICKICEKIGGEDENWG